jgi:Peptidase family S51
VRVILLGPQRRPTVDAVVRSLGLGRGGLDGPVATVTAGWQEREPDDGELSALLGGRAVNLALYRRWQDVQERDPGYAADERGLAGTLAGLQDLYLLRLDYALRAVYAVQRRNPGDQLRADTVAESVAAVRELDAAHLRRVELARGEFFQRMRPHDRPVIAEHRAAVQAILGEASALVIAGGHVGVLAEVLHLFNLAAELEAAAGRGAPVIAWSAGAMALTDRIVLFHDRAPQGPGHPEVYGSGLSVLRDLVLLPHARARMLLDDTPRMAVFARRFWPARCVLLDRGTRIELASDGSWEGGWPADVRVIAADGRVTSLEAA